MKKISVILSAATFALALVSCSSAPTYTVKGNVDGLEGVIYLIDEDAAVIDSAAVRNGSFTIKNAYEAPAYYSLRGVNEGETTFMARFFVEPGVIAVQADTSARGQKLVAKVSGTPANDAALALFNESRELFKEANDPDITSEREEELEDELDALNQTYYEANSDNYFGAFLLSQQAYYYSGADLLEAVEKFPEELQETKIVSRLRATAEQRVKTDVGEHYIEVVQKDPKGNEVTLSSVVEKKTNKYVLLDFWASWCGPCMGEVPYLTKTYKDFHKKGFEIYGVSFDTNAENWTAAIKDKGLNWVHVSDLNRFDNQAAKDYSIQAIPSNVLINCADGTVVAKNLRGDDLYSAISALLK